MSASTLYRFLSLGVGAFCILATDLVTKLWFFGHEAPILGSFIRFERHENYGLSFNIPVPVFVPLLVALLAVVAVSICVYRESERLNVLTIVALALFVGGTLGNAYDRMAFGYVRDWIAIYRSIFNLADVFILVGLGVLLTKWPRQTGPTPGQLR
jgi:signal peptidase II